MTNVTHEGETDPFFKVEDYVFLASDSIAPALAETVDPFINELEKNKNNAFNAVCFNLISVYDGSRNHDSSLRVANRTFRVGQFIAFLAGAPEAGLPIGNLLDSRQTAAKDEVFEYILDISHKELSDSPTFKELLYGCKPSIDPSGLETDIVDVFAGFSLLTMNLGHHASAERTKMETIGKSMQEASPREWENELNKWLEG